MMSKLNLSIVFLASCMIFSCTYTSTAYKDPVFKDKSTLEAELSKRIVCDTIIFINRITTRDKMRTSDLELVITNANQLPQDSMGLVDLSRSMVKMMRTSLVNAKEYDRFSVAYFFERTKGIVTERRRKTISFHPDDLN